MRKENPIPQFSSFGVPYCNLTKFKMKTPFFSSAYLTGIVAAVPNGMAHFIITQNLNSVVAACIKFVIFENVR